MTLSLFAFDPLDNVATISASTASASISSKFQRKKACQDFCNENLLAVWPNLIVDYVDQRPTNGTNI